MTIPEPAIPANIAEGLPERHTQTLPAVSPPARIVPSHGHGQLVVGSPNIGGGLSKSAYTMRMREIASSPHALDEMERVAQTGDHPHFIRAQQFAADRGYGPVKQEIAVEGAGVVLVAQIKMGLDREPEVEP